MDVLVYLLVYHHFYQCQILVKTICYDFCLNSAIPLGTRSGGNICQVIMLNDTAIRAMHGKAKKGEKVPQKSDGGGLNFVDGKYWRLSYRFGGKQKTLALGVFR